MEDFLFVMFLTAVGALLWIKYSANGSNQLQQLKRKTKNAGFLKVVEIALLLCAGAMGSFFAYQLLSPINALLAIVAAVLVVFFNMAEGYILRSTVNSFRHNNILVGGIGAISVLMLMLYSLTAGSSVIETFLNKHDDIKKYYQYEELASKQRIEGAQAQVLEAQMKAREKSPFDYLSNPDIAKAQANASTLSANEYSRMAQLMKDKAPDLKIAFGFDHESIAFLMALVLELSIVGIVIYQVLYVQNDALLASVRYENKILGWNVNPHHTANLALEDSPAPHIIGLPYAMPQVSFAGHVAPPAQPKSLPISPLPTTSGLTDKPSHSDIALAKQLIKQAIDSGRLQDKASFPLVTQILKEGGIKGSNEHRQHIADEAMNEMLGNLIYINQDYDPDNPKNGAVKYKIKKPTAFNFSKN